MHCPNKDCKSENIRVLETSGPGHINKRNIEDYAKAHNLDPELIVMRRKICSDCGCRFKTFEYYSEEEEKRDASKVLNRRLKRPK